jgi:hypothetical protein
MDDKLDLILNKLAAIENRLDVNKQKDKKDNLFPKSESYLSHNERKELNDLREIFWYATTKGFNDYQVIVDFPKMYDFLMESDPKFQAAKKYTEFIELGGTHERYKSLVESGADIKQVIEQMK